MTFSEAVEQKIRYIRLPHWADPKAHLSIHFTEDGFHGPWVTLRDCGTDTQVLWVDLMNDREDRYVPAEPADDKP